MVKGLPLLVTLAAGVAVGAVGMALLNRPGPRDLAAIALMDSFCIPWMQGTATPTTGKLKPVPTANEILYDPRSLLTLQMGETRCTITDQLTSYTGSERAAVIAAAEQRAAQFVADPVRRELNMGVPVSFAIGSQGQRQRPPVVLILKLEPGPARPDNDAALQVSFIRKATGDV